MSGLRRTGEIAGWALVLALPAVVPSQAPLVGEIAIVALFAVSLDLVVGYAGIVSLGHAAFFGLGAYAAGLFAKHATPDPVAGLLAATTLAAAFGALASPTVRRGSDLTRLMVTLGTAALLHELANAFDGLTGGADGLQGVAMGPLPGGFTFDLDGRAAAGYALAVALALFAVLRRLVRSPFGVALRAVRDHRPRAEAIGIPAARHLGATYTVAAGVAGAAGALLAQTTGFASLDVLSFARSADGLLMLVVGGTGWLYGGVAGAVVFKLLQDALASLAPQWGMFWIGSVLVLLALGGRDLVPWTLGRLGAGRRGTGAPSGGRATEGTGPDRAGAAGHAAGNALGNAWGNAAAVDAGSDDVVLACHGLTVRLGGVDAVRGVDLELRRGARHALIGPNGAGKTTLVNLLGGVLAPDAGRIVLDGTDVTREPPHRRAARGLVRSFQVGALFDTLTPRETLALAIARRHAGGADGWRPLAASAVAAEGATWLLERFRLAADADRPTRALAYGQRRLLEIALALACEPRVLVLDEPMAGVPPAEREALLETLAALPPEVAVLLIEHDMDLVFRFARRITVLAEGAVLAEGDPAAIAADARVRSAYLGPAGAGTAPRPDPCADARTGDTGSVVPATAPSGRTAAPARPTAAVPPTRAPLLRVEGLVAGHGDAVVLHDIGFVLQAGRTLALLGRNGAGKTTLIDTLAGTARQRGGRILWQGEGEGTPVALHALAAHRRAALGIGWVPQERGVFASLTVHEHLAAFARPARAGRGRAPAWTPGRVYALFPRLAERRAHLGRQLSGGEQQMLAIGRALMLAPRLLLLDEPLEGLAPVLAAEVLAAIERLTRGEGLAVIVVEQHPQAVLAIADEALVLDRGRVAHASAARELAARPDLLARWLGAAGGA
ncbi:ATP-binding cassette domain-containing protein [Comamonadaceae bacterium OTU4NAUVB1]|nr:ATP-binding cassette domain-containing protein [Comamonadaceae bacterium OTU4NAUVB1]